ncbi:helicase associated domain-containing protein [Streptomyces microflavus]
MSAIEEGVAALEAAQRALEGSLTVPRGHEEQIAVGGQEYPVKLGVWVMNQKGRRAKLPADRLSALAALGLEWAAAEGAA